MKRLRKLWSRLRLRSGKLKRQMNIVYTLALMVPLTIGGIILISSANQTLNDYYIQLLETDNRRVKTLLTEVTMQAYDVSTEVCYNSTIQEALVREYEDSSDFVAAVNGYNDLEWLNYNSLEIASIYIYTDNPTIQNYKQFRCVTEEVEASDWYQKSLTDSNAFWVSITEQGYSSIKNNLCLVRKIKLSDSEYSAVAVVRVSDSYIRSRVNSGSIIDAVSVDDQNIVYSSAIGLYGQPQLVSIDYDEPYFRSAGIEKVGDEQYFAAVSTINLYMTSSKMYVVTMDNSGFADIQSITGTWILILALAMLVPAVVLGLFTNHFTGRVNRLREEMHKARLQDYSISTEFGGNDELTEAFEDLKVMVQDIKEKDAKMYEAQLNEKELLSKQQLMEYKMLSAQINPHYLYNTLETIRMKSLTSGNREVADSIKILGKTLHYVLENTGTAFTSLQRELDHVENYLAIQRLRFGDRINYELHIQDGIDPAAYSILPLLLQPVVENAVVHGLETVDGVGVITISIGIEEEHMRIDIRDTGSGMDQEQLQSILDGLGAEQMPRSSIALYNIHQRIRLRYGGDFGVSMESQPGCGTCVTLRLPAE